jgi:hypothetical protein
MFSSRTLVTSYTEVREESHVDHTPPAHFLIFPSSHLVIVHRNFGSDNHVRGFIGGKFFGYVGIGQIGLEGN